MTDEAMGYAQAKEQLDGIVSEVRRKDVSLEKSLDLLEEGVRLANRCTELIDQAAWDDMADAGEDGEEGEGSARDSESADDTVEVDISAPEEAATEVAGTTTDK